MGAQIAHKSQRDSVKIELVLLDNHLLLCRSSFAAVLAKGLKFKETAGNSVSLLM